MINDKIELLAEVVTRSGYEDLIPRSSIAIGMAEKIIEKQLRVSEMFESVVLTLDLNGMGLLPADLLQIIEVKQGLNLSSGQFSKEKIKDNNFYGFYIETNKLYHNPIIENVALDYYKKIPSLNASNTNWLLDADPNIYLTALLMQAYQMKNDIENTIIYKNYLSELLYDYQVDDNIKRYSNMVMTARGVV
jgi:hypothetical protein